MDIRDENASVEAPRVMEINSNAPVVASSEILVEAPIDTVWEVLSDINGWPTWNPAVNEASLQGGLVPGSVFRWKAGPGGITSILREIDRPHRLGWTGKTFGINGIHVYQFEKHGAGTRVRTAESWEGLPTRLMRGRMQTMLEAALALGLKALKREAERRKRSRK